MRKEGIGTYFQTCVEAIDFSVNTTDPSDRNNRNLYVLQELNNYVLYMQNDFLRLYAQLLLG